MAFARRARWSEGWRPALEGGVCPEHLLLLVSHPDHLVIRQRDSRVIVISECRERLSKVFVKVCRSMADRLVID